MQCLHVLNAIILGQVRFEMLVLILVTAVLLHHSVMDTWTDCNEFSTGKRGNCGSAVITAVLLE